jgi:ABC-type nitrate/sulfonate/bicarbonate transport system substrate-binding protein
MPSSAAGKSRENLIQSQATGRIEMKSPHGALFRRGFLSASAGAALIAGIRPGFAQAPQPLTLITPFGFNIDFIEFMNGHSGGHFRAQGFASEIIGGTGSASAIQQLIAGRAKFTRIAGIDLLKAVGAQDVPLVAVTTMYQGSTFNLISHRAKPIRAAEELRGKRIGVVSVGGATENLLDLMLAKVGLKPADTPREVVGNNAGAVQLIEQGRIDGFVASNNVVITLRETNAPVEVWSTDRYAPMPSQVHVTLRQTIEREPESVLRFLRAINASVRELMSANFDTLLDRMARDFEIPGIRARANLKATHEAAEQLWLAQGRENLLRNVPALWRGGASLLAQAGFQMPKDVDAVYTNEFINRALTA